MKRLLKATSPPSEVQIKDTGKSKNHFTVIDLVDILTQIEELHSHKISIANTKNGLQLLVGNSTYEFLAPNNKSYPPRRLRKLET
jgi:hypothetical protein